MVDGRLSSGRRDVVREEKQRPSVVSVKLSVKPLIAEIEEVA